MCYLPNYEITYFILQVSDYSHFSLQEAAATPHGVSSGMSRGGRNPKSSDDKHGEKEETKTSICSQ